jgi:Cft2 family RNA processing exonuclease
MAQPFLSRDLRVNPIDAYVDPPVPRERAIITHGHADHARSGHGAVLATPDTIAIMKARYGEDCARAFQPLDFGVPLAVDVPRRFCSNTAGSASSSPATTSGCRTARPSSSSQWPVTCW